MPNNVYTLAVSVKFTLYSSNSPAPYDISECEGTISYSDGSTVPFSGWVAENIGTPDPNGATFSIVVADSSYSSFNNVTSVANWAITFIPRGTSNTAQSPFANNQNTISGSGATNSNGQFTLNLGNVSIKNGGDWDWSLMVQMVLPSGTVKCFASDPEMEVGA